MFILLSCLSVHRLTEVVQPTVTSLSTPPFNAELATGIAFSTSTKPAVPTQSLTPEQPEYSQITGITTILEDKIFGVAVHYYYDADRFFPASWRREPMNCTARQFDLVEAPRAYLAMLEFSLAYSLTFLEHNVTDIYLLNDLECYGKSLAGASGSSSIYLKVHPQQKGDSDQFLQIMLHKQFAYILIHNYQSQFPKQEWRSVNVDGFSYSENALEVVGQDSMQQQTTELLEAGFLAGYGTTSLNNDFSLFAEMLFTRESELCELRKSYERIDKKAYLAIEFYKAIGSEAVFLECKQVASTNFGELR